MLFHELALSSAQRDACADHWQEWRRRRRRLDRRLQDAIGTQPSLDRARSSLSAVVKTVSALADSPPRDEQGCPASRVHAAHACASTLRPRVSGDNCDDAFTATSDGWEVWHAHAASAAEWLLGASVQMTHGAGQGLEALRAVHDADAAAHVQALAARMQPGLLLGEGQITRTQSMHGSYAAGPVDMLELCELAALQRSREQTFEILQSCIIGAGGGLLSG